MRAVLYSTLLLLFVEFKVVLVGTLVEIVENVEFGIVDSMLSVTADVILNGDKKMRVREGRGKQRNLKTQKKYKSGFFIL